MVNASGILDIINSIAIFQLVFFGVFLILKGNKISSVYFLKLHLFFQLISYINYFFWTRDLYIIRPFLLISLPGAFLWAPTFYFYIRSRLYRNFKPSLKLLIHGIPALLHSLIVLYLLLQGDNFHERMTKLGHVIYVISKFQQFIYYSWTLYLIYRYQYDLKSFTSSNEERKLSWLYVVTYGIIITTFSSFVLYLIPDFSDKGTSYISYLIFINIFFFKAVLQPDQYLGIDETKLSNVRLTAIKSRSHFVKIEEMITDKQLYLDPELSLKNVSQAVKLPDRLVSQVIRQNADQNFSDYINLKRINYAKEVLISTTKSEKNVLEILYEAGFNSKSVFNSQFRKHTGLSPTLFREMNRNK